jgi:hypothetical protein
VSTDSDNTDNINDNTPTTPTTKPKKPIMEFSSDEFKMLVDEKKVADIPEDNKDLLELPEQQDTTPISEKELNKIIKDPSKRTTVMNEGELPPLENVLDEGTEIGNITNKEYQTLLDEQEGNRKKLMVKLANSFHINIDLTIGVKDGKTVYMSKKYYFNPLNNRETLRMKLKQARLSEITHRYTAIMAKRPATWTAEEAEFAPLAQFMIEIAGYQYLEYEAKLKLKMPPEDYARADTDQMKIAMDVMAEREKNPYSSRQGQLRSGAGVALGKS